MRARGQVTEICARDLRFNTEEAALLLSRLLNRPVDEAVAAEWVRRTEGWAAALRLAALSLCHRDAADKLEINFRGNNRYLKEYLLSEVLGNLPPGMQDCLLKISILDRFCDPLIAALYLPDGDTSPTDTSPRGLLQ